MKTLSAIFLAMCFVACASAANAHVLSSDLEVTVECRIAQVSGTLALTGAPATTPCVLIVGGSFSHTRDGGAMIEGAPPRDALHRVAEALRLAGYASLRYDRVGYGTSAAKPGWEGSYADRAEVACALMEFLRAQGFKTIIVAGESAGAYVACLAAERGCAPDGAILLGAFCGENREVFEYNFGRLPALFEKYPNVRERLESRMTGELVFMQHIDEAYAAISESRRFLPLENNGQKWARDLIRMREEIEKPAPEMFRFLKCPVLALGGGEDMNVPPDHVTRIGQRLLAAGNDDVTTRSIQGADHSFQRVAPTEEERVLERHTFASFKRAYVALAYREIDAWMASHFPLKSPPDPILLDRSLEDLAASAPWIAAAAIATEVSSQDSATSETFPALIPVSESRPERLKLAPGVTVVRDATDPSLTPGVETLEGRIGPLIYGAKAQSHFITMEGGTFVGEHPHSSESLIYTAKGRWVLCSGGNRTLMETGSLFHFAAGAPTGYEVPFAEPATILIFKARPDDASEEALVGYLRGMAENVAARHDKGEPFRLNELPPDHAARVFGRTVNPDFDKQFGELKKTGS